MADLVTLDDNFNRGFQQDTPREHLPKGVAWRYKDYMPGFNGPARQRGGWGHYSNTMGAGEDEIVAIVWAPFVWAATGARFPKLIMITEDEAVPETFIKRVNADGTFNTISLTVPGWQIGDQMICNPFWFRDRVIIPAWYRPGGSGAGPRTVTITAVTPTFDQNPLSSATLSGTIGGTWGFYVALMNGIESSTVRRNRVRWSAAGDSGTWPANSFWDMPDEIWGYAPIGNLQIFFGKSETWALVGDTPPPNGNLTFRYLHDQGCFDPRCVSRWKEYAIWANKDGIFRTDGTNLADITSNAGIANFWHDIVHDFDLDLGWRAAGVVFNDEYVICVTDEAEAQVICLAIHLDRYTAREITNVEAHMFAQVPDLASGEGLLAAFRSYLRVVDFGTMWDVDNIFTEDGDSADVLPELETRYYTLDTLATKRLRSAYVRQWMTDGGGTPATVELSYTKSIDDPTPDYTFVGAIPLSTGVVNSRQPPKTQVPIRTRAQGIAFKLKRTGLALDHVIHSLEIEGFGLEGHR